MVSIYLYSKITQCYKTLNENIILTENREAYQNEST